MGRPASGVAGINLGKNDVVVGMDLVRPGAELLVVTRQGQGKRTCIVEVCRDCAWNHLVTSYVLGTDGLPARRRARSEESG